jgi:hypothetical protein
MRRAFSPCSRWRASLPAAEAVVAVVAEAEAVVVVAVAARS